MFNPTDEMASIPRVSLAQLPTPIERLGGLSAYLGGPEIFVKRDDLTGLATGGNKTRKLEFLMGAALNAEADCVITAGSTQSNHARQTAAAARKMGLEPHLVLYAADGKPPAATTGNVLIDALVGAVFHWTEEQAPYTETITNVETDLKAAGRTPYVIPYGGSNGIGVLGYVEAMREVNEQIRKMDVTRQPVFDAHVFATSSGGTQAGMILGTKMAADMGTNWGGAPRLLGISVDAKRGELAPTITSLVSAGAETLGKTLHLNENAVLINDEYLGGGYAVVGEVEREAVKLAAQMDGLLVDPVYTGRALGGLIDMIRQGAFSNGDRILFWHTGGTAALFAFAEALGFDR